MDNMAKQILGTLHILGNIRNDFGNNRFCALFIVSHSQGKRRFEKSTHGKLVASYHLAQYTNGANNTELLTSREGQKL